MACDVITIDISKASLKANDMQSMMRHNVE